MTRIWLLGGAALLVAACSGGAATSGSSDGGEDGASQDGHFAGDSGSLGDVHPAGDGGDAGGADSGPQDSGAHDAPDGAHDSGAADVGSDAPWIINAPSDVPQVVDNGGPALKAPVLQSISFSGYDQTAAIDDFVATVGATAYWQGAVAEYGVAAPTVKPAVHLTETALTMTDDTAIQTWLAQTVGSNAALMTPTANALYVLSYPSTTTITFLNSTSCTAFGAYHSSTTINGVQVAYAVIPECTYPPDTTLQSTTDSLSHELAEAVTDPLPLTQTTTWQGTDANHTFWEVIVGGDGEVGDMCSFFSSSFFQPPGYAYKVQRIWSNASVKKGHDPCQPEIPAEVYFNSMPLLPDMVSILWSTQMYPTEGVQIAVGASKTIPVQLYSEGPMAPWTVSAVDYSTSGNNLTFAWDKTSGQNGDTLHLTITVNATDATYGGNAFYVESTSGSLGHTWLGYVGR